MIRSVRSDQLYRFLDWFVRRAFEDLMVPYKPSGPYLSDVLFRCSRTDSVYRYQSFNGRTLHRLAELLLAQQERELRPSPDDTDLRARKLEPPRRIILTSPGKGGDAPVTPDLPEDVDKDKIGFSQSETLRFRRHVGDLALFLSGLFRNHLDRGGVLGLYLREGKQAYRTVAEDLDAASPGSRRLFQDLSDHFRRYTEALDYMRKVYLPSEEKAEEGFHRFREALDEEWHPDPDPEQ